MKTTKVPHLQLFLFFLMVACLLGGCGGSDNPAEPNQNSDDPVETILITGEDRDILSTAAMNYITLLQTMSASEARTSSVTTLNGTAGVTEAVLFEDGFTIHVAMDSGAQAAFNTLDLDAVNEGVEVKALNPNPASKASPAGNTPVRDDAIDKGGLSVNAHSPTSRRVLILVPSAVDMPGAMNAADFIESTLKLADWDEEDFVVKYRSSSSSTAITPDDYLDFKEYGVVVIFAHAIHGAPSGDGYHYIQACSATDYSLVATAERSAVWNEWIESGKLLTGGSVFSGDECFYLRSDLFASESAGLPKTLMFLVTPWGDELAHGLDQRGAASVLAWDNVFRAVDAYASVKSFFQEMAGGQPSPADSDVFRKVGFVRESINPEDGSESNLTMFSESSQLYLPAWATFTFDGRPDGTVNSGIGLSYMVTTANGVHGPNLSVGTAITAEADNLVPVQVEIVGSAVSADNNTLAALRFTTSLQAGFNNIRVDFSRQHVPCIPYRFDWEGTDGTHWTSFRPTFTIEQNPSSNRYKVFTEAWPDGYEILQPAAYEDIYIRGDYCFDKAQIEYIFGYDPFDLEPEQVVWIPGESLTGYSHPDDVTWDDVTDDWITYAALMDREWAEYLLSHADVYTDVIFQ